MLVPVSPSGTGYTFRELSSSRCSSRARRNRAIASRRVSASRDGTGKGYRRPGTGQRTGPPYDGSVRRLLAFVVLLVGVAAACTAGATQGAVTPIPAVNATSAPGLPATANALPSVDGSQMRRLLSRLRGTPVVLNVWGSWCGPCRLEGPHLATAARRYGRRVQFLGLDVKDSLGPARAFIRQMGWPYPSVF